MEPCTYAGCDGLCTYPACCIFQYEGVRKLSGMMGDEAARAGHPSPSQSLEAAPTGPVGAGWHVTVSNLTKRSYLARAAFAELGPNYLPQAQIGLNLYSHVTGKSN
eukprot:760578-Hanusia_phi.AAC.3